MKFWVVKFIVYIVLSVLGGFKMKEFEIWTTDGRQYVSSWDDWYEAGCECQRLNNSLACRYPIGFEVRKNIL